MQFFLDALGDIIDLASKGGGALKTAVDIHERLKKPKGDGKPVGDADMERLVLELMSEVKDAMIANIALKAELLALHEKALRAQKAEDDFARYELWETSAGQTVYRLRDNDRKPGEPAHYLCPNCKEEGRKSILQGHSEAKQCHACSHWFRFKEDEPLGMISLRGTRSLD